MRRDDDVAQVLALADRHFQERQALRRRDKHTYAAIFQDVCNLIGLEQRIDRNECAAGLACADCIQYDSAIESICKR